LQKQLAVCSSIDGLYVDGKFKSAPKFFHQLFTFHGLIFFLPANIRPTSYEDVFRRTVSEAAKRDVNSFSTFFDVLLTVRLSTIPAINQLNSHILVL
jgi:hypothetical protein